MLLFIFFIAFICFLVGIKVIIYLWAFIINNIINSLDSDLRLPYLFLKQLTNPLYNNSIRK